MLRRVAVRYMLNVQMRPTFLHSQLNTSTPIDGDSGGLWRGVAGFFLLCSLRVRREVVMTGALDEHGNVGVVGDLFVKLDAVYNSDGKDESDGPAITTVYIPRTEMAELEEWRVRGQS